MPLDSQQATAGDPLVTRPHRVPTPVVLAGVAGACLLGAGLGLWARPSDLERPFAHRPRPAPVIEPTAAAPRRRIEIRVDGAARPGAPAPSPAIATKVEAPAPHAVAVAPAPARPPELQAPKRPPEGLMRVHAVAPPRLAEAPRATPRLPAPDGLAARAAAERRAQAAAARKAAADAERQAREAAEAAARKAKLEKARVAAAAAAKAREKTELKLAARKAAEHRIAEQAAASARARKTRLAEEKAARTAKAHADAIRLADDRRKAEAKAAAQRAAPPVRVAEARSRCASPDPGATLACADPALGAAERQLNRAYRQAQAAGVPEERLARQQQRWLAARANAARQAPWAVHDIYLARIAELQDQTRAATEGE